MLFLKHPNRWQTAHFNNDHPRPFNVGAHPQTTVLPLNGSIYFNSFFKRWCLLYTYLPLFEKELQDLLVDYNSHKIRKQRGKQRPDGIPKEMYRFPEMHGKVLMPHFSDQQETFENPVYILY